MTSKTTDKAPGVYYVYELRADTVKSGGRPNGVNEHGGPAGRGFIEQRVKRFFPDAVFEPASSYEGYEDGIAINAGGYAFKADPSSVTFIFTDASDRDDGEEPGETRIGEMAVVER